MSSGWLVKRFNAGAGAPLPETWVNQVAALGQNANGPGGYVRSWQSGRSAMSVMCKLVSPPKAAAKYEAPVRRRGCYQSLGGLGWVSLTGSVPDIKELNLADAVKRLEAHDVRSCRLPARVRRESHLQGASDAIWQVEAPAESGRAHLSAIDQGSRSRAKRRPSRKVYPFDSEKGFGHRSGQSNRDLIKWDPPAEGKP
jgi:hypothetical protein